MIKKVIFYLVLISSTVGFSQVGINTTTPDASSVLDINSTTGGVLIPRVTTAERDLIASPANGLFIYNTDSDQFQYNSNTTVAPVWEALDNATTTTSNIGQSVKYSNTDVTTNMNPDTAINAPLFGTLLWNDNTTLYTIDAANQRVTVGEAGRYKIVVNVPLATTSGRDRFAPEMRINIGGTPTGTYSSTGYIRTNNGHQESSLHITEVLELPIGAVISVDIVRAGIDSNNAANIVTIREAGSASIYIEKLL